MARKPRAWFFDTQPDSSGDRFRHKNIPTEETLIHLLDSVPFFNEETDGATITQQGLVKIYPDETVIKDRNTPGHNQPHQYVLIANQAPGSGVRVGNSYVESTPDVNLNDGTPVSGSGLRVTGVVNKFTVGSEDISRIGYQFELDVPSIDPDPTGTPPFFTWMPNNDTYVPSWDQTEGKHKIIKTTDLGIKVNFRTDTAGNKIPFCVITSLKDLDYTDPIYAPLKDYDAYAWEGLQFDGTILHLKAQSRDVGGALVNNAIFKMNVERPPLAHENFATFAFGNSLSDETKGQAVATIRMKAFEPHTGLYGAGQWGSSMVFENTPSGTTQKIASFMISADNTLYVNPDNEYDTAPTSSFHVNGSESKLVREIAVDNYEMDTDSDGKRDNIVLGATGKVGRDLNLFLPEAGSNFKGRILEVKNVCEGSFPYNLRISSKAGSTIYSNGPTNNYIMSSAGETAKFVCDEYNGVYYWFVFGGSTSGGGSGVNVMSANAPQADRELTITHNWGTMNTIVQTFTSADGKTLVGNTTRTVNSVTVRLDTAAPGQWTAVVQG